MAITFKLKNSMTIEEIKEKLPDVKVKYQGKIYNAILTGRKNTFATIHTITEYNVQSFDYSWQAIERAINNDTALIA